MSSERDGFDLSNARKGDRITYLACNTLYFDYHVLDTDEERQLPYVRIAARSARGLNKIAEDLSKTAVTGIILGSSDEYAENIHHGLLLPGRMVAVEMVTAGEITHGIFPAPESRPALLRAN
jgi:hypothetical protein